MKPTDEHQYAEAFCLMWYGCKCGHQERIWNSRNGITPFSLNCPSCGQTTLQHTAWALDEVAPNHMLHVGQQYFRDGRPEEAQAAISRRFKIMENSKYPIPKHKQPAVRRSIMESEFKPGWPKLDRVKDKTLAKGAES